MVWYYFYICNGNGILETQKVHVGSPSRCWKLRAWLGGAGSLQDQWEAEMCFLLTTPLTNGHAMLYVLAP